jgi:propionyl-CoA synthetase
MKTAAHAGGGQTRQRHLVNRSEKYKVTAMFSAPTVRVLKKAGPALLKKVRPEQLRALFLAGEPLDEDHGAGSAKAGRAIIDNYWQTSQAGPSSLMTSSTNGVEKRPKFSSPACPM